MWQLMTSFDWPRRTERGAGAAVGQLQRSGGRVAGARRGAARRGPARLSRLPAAGQWGAVVRMRWEARGVAARLCSVGRPVTDRLRRPARQGQTREVRQGPRGDRVTTVNRGQTGAVVNVSQTTPDRQGHTVNCGQTGAQLRADKEY